MRIQEALAELEADREPDLVEVIRGGRDIPIMDRRIADGRSDLDEAEFLASGSRRKRNGFVLYRRPGA